MFYQVPTRYLGNIEVVPLGCMQRNITATAEFRKSCALCDLTRPDWSGPGTASSRVFQYRFGCSTIILSLFWLYGWTFDTLYTTGGNHPRLHPYPHPHPHPHQY